MCGRFRKLVFRHEPLETSLASLFQASVAGVHVLSFSLLGVGRQAKGGSRDGLEPATGTKCPGRSRSGAARCPVVVAPLPNPPATHGGCSQGERGRSGCSNASLRSCRLFSYLCQLRWPGHKAQRSVGGVTPGGTASNPQSHRGSRGGPGGAEQGQGTQALPQT